MKLVAESPVKLLTGTTIKGAREVLIGTVAEGIDEIHQSSGQGYAKKLVTMKITGPPQAYTLDVCNSNEGNCIRELVHTQHTDGHINWCSENR